MRRLARCLMLVAPLVAGGASAQQTSAPHEWLFGSWTGGIYPPTDTEGPRCTAQPTVIFTREIVLRAGLLDPAYRQRVIETVAARDGSATFRFQSLGGAFGGRLPPDIGFGCPGGPDELVVEQTGPDEITFPNCREMPSPLRRCGSPNR